MRVPLEAFVPHDQSVRYQLHRAYFRAIGEEAWTSGHVPYRATSNAVIARQHATTALHVVDELVAGGRLHADDEVWLLEIGGGHGAFARAFLRALESGTGFAGRRLLSRLRYVLSDVGPSSVRDALAGPELGARARAGTLVPALFDLDRPDELSTLDGRPLAAPLALVFAGYVCCVAPVQVVRRRGGRHFERLVRCEVDVPDDAAPADRDPSRLLQRLLAGALSPGLMGTLRVRRRWRAVSLDRLRPGTVHGEIVRRCLAPFDDATLAHPRGFIDAVAGLRPRLLGGAAIVVSDYGFSDPSSLSERGEPSPRHYGNSLTFPVEMGVLDVAAPMLGMSVARSRDALASVHVAVLRHQPELPEGFADFVADVYERAGESEDLLDFDVAARAHAAAGEHRAAARMWRRCARLEPDNAAHVLRLGEACLQAGMNREAVRWLEEGAKLDAAREHDSAFPLARALYRLGRHADAAEALRASISRHPHPVAWSNLGAVHEALGDLPAARQAYAAALRLDPAEPHARARLEALGPG